MFYTIIRCMLYLLSKRLIFPFSYLLSPSVIF